MGPVDIGDGCIINERASIGCCKPLVGEIGSDSNIVASTSLAAGVLIESGATIEAGSIGDFTIVETGAKTGRGAVVGKNCKICAQVQIGEGEVIEDSTVVFGSGWGERRVEGRGDLMDEKRERWMREQRKVLRRAWTGK